MAISYRRFGTAFHPHPQGTIQQWLLHDVSESLSCLTSTCCLETSVTNHHHSPCNNPEERSSQLLRGGSLKSGKTLRRSAVAKRSQITEAPFHALFKKVVPLCTAVSTLSPHRDEAQTKSLPVRLGLYSSLDSRTNRKRCTVQRETALRYQHNFVT